MSEEKITKVPVTDSEAKPTSSEDTQANLKQKNNSLSISRGYSKVVQDLPEIYAFNSCGKTYGKKSHLLRHERVHDATRMYRCLKCCKGFDYRSSIIAHMRTHSNERPFICGECDKRFTVKSSLNRHKVTHMGKKRYLCETCGKLYTTMQVLRKHNKYLHLNITGCRAKPSFKKTCEICDKVLFTKKGWSLHQKIHSGDKPLGCLYCERRFRYSGSLKYHLRTHTGEKPFKCKSCEKSFRSSASLREHNNIHHTSLSKRRKYECQKCKRRFLNRKSIIEHRCINEYPCWTCRRRFKSLNQLEKHKRTHTIQETRKHVCSKCKRRFSRTKSLKNHKCNPVPVIPVRIFVPFFIFTRSVGQVKPTEVKNSNVTCHKCGKIGKSHSMEKHVCRITKTLPVHCNVCLKNFYSDYYKKRHKCVGISKANAEVSSSFRSTVSSGPSPVLTLQQQSLPKIIPSTNEMPPQKAISSKPIIINRHEHVSNKPEQESKAENSKMRGNREKILQAVQIKEEATEEQQECSRDMMTFIDRFNGSKVSVFKP